MRTSFYTKTEDLVDAALTFDARPDIQVFFTPFAFKTGSGRTAENALHARAFWLDIDCGEGKAYADRAEARAALASFSDKLGWAPPLEVASGPCGVHAYWPMARCLSRDEWLTRARRLKAACKAYGLDADPARTADAASLLRPVGVHHKKGQPVLVEVLS